MKKFVIEENSCAKTHMLCPICGYDYTHLYKVEQYLEKDERLCSRMYFYCESEHKFFVDFHQHEGITYIETEVIK